MAEGIKKIPRLGKAASEFNVSISTIVELLNKKLTGAEIVDNPNTKLTQEMYDILLKEFQSDKIDKEKASGLDMDYSFNKQKQADAVTAAKPEPAPQPKPEPKEVLIKTNEITEPAAPTIIKAEVKGPKILGTLDLDALNPKKKEEAPAPVETVEAKSDEPAEKPKEPKTPKTPEHIETVVEKLPETKVVGKIDIDEPAKKKSTKKSASAAPTVEVVDNQEVTEPVVVPAPEPEPAKAPEKPAPEERKVEHIKTVVEQLEGPKILGHIELPVQKRGKDSASDAAKKAELDKKKGDKKRKRIRKPVGGSEGGASSSNNKKNEVVKNEISSEEVAKQLKETLQRMNPLGKSKISKRKKEKRKNFQAEMLEHELQEEQDRKILKVTEFITANELATLMNVPVTQIIATCMSIKVFVAINQRLDAETISLLADEFGYQVEFVGIDTEETAAEEVDAPEDLQPRHPIITVMGHVDHGKTSLLDYIRKTNVIAGEAGGITQHIGAYEVQLPDKRRITFLDTPGHEAFTAMRARGAKVTDLCIIVIAADDSIMPQTVEAINHAQAAGVPMVFAITKIDKQNANPEKIKEGLANMNILVEDWGGSYQCQEIDAKHGTNVNELLEKVLLEAELLELKANPNKAGVGTIIESSLDKGKGYVAKILVQNGTIKIGDPIWAGSCHGKVKALFNERNQLVKSAGPAVPVLLLGLNGAPQAGDIFRVCHSEHDARIAATKRQQLVREMGLRTQKHITLDEIGRRLAIGDFKELNIIVKADVDGSAEALTDELLKLSTEQVQVNVIHKSVGQVTDTDVMLASASNAIIIAFQVRPSASSRKLAEQEEIDIRTYSIIYTAINEIKDAIAGMRTPEISEKILCNIEIREVFKITKVGNVAGCMVLDGKLQRSTKVRLIRDGIVIYTGKLGSLRRFKDDVKEVSAGQDCGLNIENFNDIKVGDIIEGYEEYEVKNTDD